MKIKSIFPFIILSLFIISIVTSCKHEIPQPVISHNDSIDYPISETNCDSDTVYFQNTILPIFVSNCAQQGCHNSASHEGGIKLNNYTNIINTGNIQAFNPGHGNIIDVISTSNPGDIMPPPGSGLPPLTNQQINSIIKWINQGALNNYCDACDTSSVTYSKSVVPIIAAKCKGCHQGSSPGGGIPLVTYTDIFATAMDGSLLGCINQDNAYSAMPKGSSKLPDCDIAKIRIWIDSGAPNN